MKDRGLVVANSLQSDTRLSRYISLSQFVSFVESGHTYLSKVLDWPDTWEMPASKLPLLDDGDLTYPTWSISDDTYGQSWSLLSESDALWRIYSVQEEGIMIQTSVSKFRLFEAISCGMLAPVVYYRDLLEGIQQLDGDSDYIEPFAGAFLKRRAFEHEQEVRLVTVNDERCLGLRHPNHSYIETRLDAVEFINEITIDPRASDWYIDAIQRYCKRAGFKIKPIRSSLYSDDVYGATGVVRRYVPVDREED